jgi:hypothetical protein
LHGEGRESHTLRLLDELAMESASDRCLLGEVSGVTTLVSNSPRLGVEEYGGNDVDAEVGVIPSLQCPQIDHIVTGFVGRCVLTVNVGSCPLTPLFILALCDGTCQPYSVGQPQSRCISGGDRLQPFQG